MVFRSVQWAGPAAPSSRPRRRRRGRCPCGTAARPQGRAPGSPSAPRRPAGTGESLAMRTASSSSSKGMTTGTGPKVRPPGPRRSRGRPSRAGRGRMSAEGRPHPFARASAGREGRVLPGSGPRSWPAAPRPGPPLPGRRARAASRALPGAWRRQPREGPRVAGSPRAVRSAPARGFAITRRWTSRARPLGVVRAVTGWFAVSWRGSSQVARTAPCRRWDMSQL